MFKKLIAGASLGVAVVVSTVSQAFAAVPAEVTTAIGDMKTDGLTVAGAVLAGVIAIWAVKRIRSAL